MFDSLVSLPRLYVACLRQDWTQAERDAVEHHAATARLYAKVQAEVWHPSPEQLLAYAAGCMEAVLSVDEMADLRYHLLEDRCVRCLRIVS